MPNHDYKAIADRLVERGVVAYEPARGLHAPYWLLLGADEFVSFAEPIDLCHDWRVAGRCLEIEPEKVLRIMRRALSLVEARKIKLTLAIILAYLEATDEA